MELMEYFGSMTCPANVVTPEGTMDLGNHVQWIDIETIDSCNTTFLPNEENGEPVNQLTDDSYLVVRDYRDDAATFLIGDYLVF